MTNDNKKNIFWLSGSFHQRTRAIEKIKNSIGKYELFFFDDESQPTAFEICVLQNDMFEENKLIILNGIPEFSSNSNKKIIDILEKTPDSCHIIINNVDPKSKSVLYKHVKEKGRVVEFAQYLDKKQAPSWIKDRFDEKKTKVLPEKGIDLILESIGFEYSKGIDIDRLHLEIEKICSYIGNKKIIEEDDIVKASCKYNYFIVWNIFDELDRRNYLNCILLFNKACICGSSIIEVTNEILHMMLWRYKLLLLLKEFSVNLQSSEVINNMKEFKKISKKSSGLYGTFGFEQNKEGGDKQLYNDFVITNNLNGSWGRTAPINVYSREELFIIYKTLVECLMMIRLNFNEQICCSMVDNFFQTVCKKNNYSLLESMRSLPNV
jgi:DNA polymerase III delta subunit